MSQGFNRALLKISGEALGGDRDYGLDPEKTEWIAREIVTAAKDDCQVGIVVGGGNILRGADASAVGVPRLVGDHMGMIATALNAIALRWALQKAGRPAIVMSSFPIGRFVETFEREKALDYLGNGFITVFAGGTGNPCFTTDSAAALRAVEIEADVMIKCTQVDGVYDKDPKKFPDAVFIKQINPEDIVTRQLKIVDATCADILAARKIPAIVLNLHKVGNLRRALAGEQVGTVISQY
jgi:uridylate kinase